MLTLENARAWYHEGDVIHDFSHIERVYALARNITIAEGADWEIVSAAALLHDSRGSESGGPGREKHHLASAKFAAQVLTAEGWDKERIAAVQHCIRAHRFRSGGEKPETLEAQIMFDADKLDVIGAIGVARTIGYAAIINQPFYEEPSDQFRLTGEHAPGEKHSAYHEYLFKLTKIKDLLFTASAKKIAEERDRYIREYFDRLRREIAGEC